MHVCFGVAFSHSEESACVFIWIDREKSLNSVNCNLCGNECSKTIEMIGNSWKFEFKFLPKTSNRIKDARDKLLRFLVTNAKEQ